jgi:16S rRNA (guanine527-N7)-methyltransferase
LRALSLNSFLLSGGIMRETPNVRDQFINALKRHQAAFGIDLPDDTLHRLASYYELIGEHNPILHLVGPCSPEEFAVRHILESLTLLKHLPAGAKFADVGTGAGLPSIPCLLAREDLTAVLIESKLKKARFLSEAVSTLGLAKRVVIFDRQFEETEPGEARFITCRALDKFTEKLVRLVKWSAPRTMLLFGGNSLGDSLEKLRLPTERELLPMSDQRFLFKASPRR